GQAPVAEAATDFPEAEESSLDTGGHSLFMGVKQEAGHETPWLGEGCEIKMEEESLKVSLEGIGCLERGEQKWKTEVKQETRTESLASQSGSFQELMVQEKTGFWESSNEAESCEMPLEGAGCAEGEVKMWKVEIKQETGNESPAFQRGNFQEIPVLEKRRKGTERTGWESGADGEPQQTSLEGAGFTEDNLPCKTEIKEEGGNDSHRGDFPEVPIQVKTGEGKERRYSCKWKLLC
ncbi:UNVERIFIED_CONTAM: hypothetical protein K2H54_064119, partial [Gekko kuhli]